MKELIRHWEFMYPWVLMLLPLLWLGYYILRRIGKKNTATVNWVHKYVEVSNIKLILAQYLHWLIPIALSLFVTALARPQQFFNEEKIKAEGIDIVLAMDVSASMLAEDFKPNRLETCKEIASDFVSKRTYDRIGLVIFSGESFTQSPLTTNHDIVKGFLQTIQPGFLEDGTAIGMGLATSVSALKNAAAKSKIVVLLTDGENNSGIIDPKTATELAKSLDIRVYTIGVGKSGIANVPVGMDGGGNYVFRPMNLQLDPTLLIEIADQTGGKFYRASSEEELKAIYADIDKLERTEIEVNVFRRQSERYRPLVMLGIGLLSLMYLLQFLYLKKYR